MQEAGPGDARRDLSELRERILELGTQGNTVSLRLLAAPMRRVLFDTGEIEGYGWATFTSAEGLGDGNAGRRGGHRIRGNARERARARRDRRALRHVRDRDRDGLRAAGLGRLVDGGVTAATRTTTRRPPTTASSTRPTRCVTTLEAGPVRARVQIDTDYTWPAFANGDYRSCDARSDETVPVTVTTILELRAGERFLRVAHELDNRARDHRLRALPAAGNRQRLGCRVRVHGRAPRPHRRRRRARARPADVPVPTVRRRVRRRRERSHGRARARARRPARVRSGRRRPRARAHAVAIGRLSLPLRAVAAPQPGRPDRCRRGAQLPGRQRAEYAVLLHPGDWRAADCYAAADALLVPFERARSTGPTAPTRPRADPHCASRAPKCRRCSGRRAG